jgi:hypothetical protein
MRAIQKVTSSELLTKQAMTNKIIDKNTYILKLLLNVVIGTEALVI